jgi:hypothetical protein
MASLIDRVKNILLTPQAEWQVIDGESGDTKEVFTYVAILAAIPAIISLILTLAFSSSFAGLGFGTGFLIATTVVGYLLGFVSIYLLALITDALAATFGGEKHAPSALKLIAYALTPFWVGSILVVIPLLGILLWIAGLVYTIYVLYLGVPVLMRAPQDKSVGYTIVIVVIGIVVWVVVGYIGIQISRIVA